MGSKRSIGQLIKREKGVASLMFVLMLPALIGIMAFSLDSASYLHAKTRINDAVEVANMALSARGSKNVADNKELAVAFIQANMQSVKKNDIDVTVTYRDCKNEHCITQQSAENEGLDSIEYELEGEVRYSPLFPVLGEKGVGFSGDLPLQGKAYLRKYNTEAVDVVLVADFSGSMRKYWAPVGMSKMAMLKHVVDKVATEFEKVSNTTGKANTLSIVPFNGMTRRHDKISYKSCYTSQLIMDRSHGFDESAYGRKGYGLIFYDVDYKKVINNLFVEKSNCVYASDNKYHSGHFFTVKPQEGIQTIPRATRFMRPGGVTASYEGIIRGAQLANSGKNPRRLIVVLSDGEDSNVKYFLREVYKDKMGRYSDYGYRRTYSDIHKNLLDKYDYCSVIRNTLDAKVVGDRHVKSKIAVIGFDYKLNDNKNLRRCAGDDNVYSAENMDGVYKTLLQLISEQVGRISQPKAADA